MKKLLLMTLLSIFSVSTLSGCFLMKKDSSTSDGGEDGDDEGGVDADDQKELLSYWTNSSGVFHMDLSGSGGNLSGTPFTMEFTEPYGTCECDVTITGTDYAGMISVSNCSTTVDLHGSWDCADDWEGGAVDGVYDNLNGSMQIDGSGLIWQD